MGEKVDQTSGGSFGLERRRWHAEMIAPDIDEGQSGPSSYVATSFTLESDPAASAMLHISALGLYRAFINGKRIGDDQLTPGWNCYDDRIAYQSYDLTGLLKAGDNRIEIWLGDGWYRSPMMWRDKTIPNCWGERTGAIAEIVADGDIMLATGPTWTSGRLPITQSGIYYGEDYDARLEGAESSGGVEVLDFKKTLLIRQETPPVAELEPLEPQDRWLDDQGREIIDFGQNTAGYIRFSVRGAAGTSVLIEHSEVLGPERAFDNRNYRGARAAVRYTLAGGDEESYTPFFTFMGFRYARVTIEGQATLSRISSVPISSVPEMAGGLSSGVPAVDRLVLNTVWSQRSNFIEVPTDCPQRDERMGWTGDAQVFAGTACWLADSERFLQKYLRDVMHDQRANGAIPYFSPDPTRLHQHRFEGVWAGATGWGDVITLMPWQLYLHYGDAGILRACFPAMQRWLDHLWSISNGPIIRPNAGWAGFGFTFGDWLQPIGDNRKPRPTIADDCAATLYHAISTDIAAEVAAIIGEEAEAKRLRARFDEISAAFRHEYISASGRLAHNDQTSYALAFLYGLIPDEHKQAAAGYFRRVIEDAGYLIGTGFIGTPALLPALTKLGMNDLAEKVFLNREVPGWLYQVEQGATTIWERWDAIGPDGEIYEPSMNSYNHYAYGAVCQWLFEDVAGVTPLKEAPGFDRVRIAPAVLPGLGHLSIWHDCRHGRIEAAWRIDGARVHYDLMLPEGSEGVMVKADYPGLTLGGSAVDDADEAELLLRSGRHQLIFDLG